MYKIINFNDYVRYTGDIFKRIWTCYLEASFFFSSLKGDFFILFKRVKITVPVLSHHPAKKTKNRPGWGRRWLLY